MNCRRQGILILPVTDIIRCQAGLFVVSVCQVANTAKCSLAIEDEGLAFVMHSCLPSIL